MVPAQTTRWASEGLKSPFHCHPSPQAEDPLLGCGNVPQRRSSAARRMTREVTDPRVASSERIAELDQPAIHAGVHVRRVLVRTVLHRILHPHRAPVRQVPLAPPELEGELKAPAAATGTGRPIPYPLHPASISLHPSSQTSPSSPRRYPAPDRLQRRSHRRSSPASARRFVRSTPAASRR